MKIEGDFMFLETAEEAAVIGGYEAWNHGPVGCAQVLEAITPKEGDAVFVLYGTIDDCDPPRYHTPLTKGWMHYPIVKANALSLGKTVGELRKLLAWVKS